MPRMDVVHLGLMLSALGLAYLLPFELLLIAYAVLGPARYLTEISWLHDRQYFLSAKRLALVVAAIEVAAVYIPDALGSARLIGLAVVAAAVCRSRGSVTTVSAPSLPRSGRCCMCPICHSTRAARACSRSSIRTTTSTGSLRRT